jgi:hypothetical protein
MTQPEVPNAIRTGCAVLEVGISETAEGVVTGLVRSGERVNVL